MSNFKKFVAGFSTIAMAVSMFAFAPAVDAATAGGVYKTTDGTVWFVTKDMQKRPFTSAGAFMSYGFLSFSQVTDADSSVTSLPSGSFIAPQDGRIFCATETKGTDVAGECSLITGGKKAAFTSASVFTGQGYSFSRAYYGDSSFLEKTSNIDNASAQHRPGTLINNNGTVQLVVNGGLWGVPSMDVFNSWGWSFADVVPANSADVLLSQTGVIPARQAGDLVPTATSNGGGNQTPGDCNLDGNAGSITITSTGTYGSEEVGEGEEDQGVLSFEVEADEDSDIAVTSVKLEFVHTGAAGSDDFEDYADEVKVWYAGEEVGSADADDFSEDSGTYSKSISLDCSEVSADETGEFSVSVTAVDNLDSIDMLDANNDWDVDLVSVRYEDADGVTTTEDGAPLPLNETFEFVDFATANDVSLQVSLTNDMDEVNDAHNIVVDEDSTTDDVELLAFTLEADGDSDIWVDEIPVTFTTGTANITDVMSRADLYHGDTLVDTKSLNAAALTQTVTFDDLDIDIDAEDEEDFTVKVRIQAQDTNYLDGETVQAEITTANADAIDAEDEEGDAVDATDISGSAAADASSLTLTEVTVDIESKTSDQNDDGTVGTFTFQVRIGADGGDVDVDAASIVETVLGGAATASLSVVEISGDSTMNAANDYTVADGDEALFSITYTINPGVGESGSYYVRLDSIDGIVIDEEEGLNGPESLTE